MKHTLLAVAVAALIFSGCNCHEPHPNPDVHCVVTHKYTPPPHHSGQNEDSTYCEYIPADSANVMISSYLNSINYQQNDTDLHSLIYNADSLRAFLSNNPKIKHVKFMLAHTLDYINSGGRNQYAGYQWGALTLVLAGYDAQNNYVYYNYPQSQCPMVEDHCEPCPNQCPVQGTASSDTLVFPSSSRK